MSDAMPTPPAAAASPAAPRPPLRTRLFHGAMDQWLRVDAVRRKGVRYLKLNLLHQHRHYIKRYGTSAHAPAERPRVLVHVAHVVSPEEHADRDRAATKVTRLAQTIDGLFTSFAHCRLTVRLSTVPGRHVHAFLPEYQRVRVAAREEPGADPMRVGYRAQQRLVDDLEHFDWFMFVEDDIVLTDPLFLDKLAAFNARGGVGDAVLLPNRYEMFEGAKSYIDFTVDRGLKWVGPTTIDVDGARFCEYTNPHAGLYCLSQAQLRRWAKTGRTFRDENLIVGPLESAATYCLYEAFRLYKPHPANLHYLEVRHHDTKYSQAFPNPSAYRLVPTEPVGE